MVENEAWQTPFMKATKAVSRGPKRPAFFTASGTGATCSLLQRGAHQNPRRSEHVVHGILRDYADLRRCPPPMAASRDPTLVR